MDESQPVSEESRAERCFLCGKEGALAIFGVLFGLAVIAMSVDVARKLRAERFAVTVEGGSDD